MKLDQIWYGKHPLRFILAPLSWLFCIAVRVRRQAYQYGLLKSHTVSVPVIIVGNITVGGTGKTPLVIWLAQFLKNKVLSQVLSVEAMVDTQKNGHNRFIPIAIHTLSVMSLYC